MTCRLAELRCGAGIDRLLLRHFLGFSSEDKVEREWEDLDIAARNYYIHDI